MFIITKDDIGLKRSIFYYLNLTELKKIIIIFLPISGNAVVVQLARTSPCQGEGRRFESGSPLVKFCPDGGIGRHEGLKILWINTPCGFESHFGHHNQTLRNFANRFWHTKCVVNSVQEGSDFVKQTHQNLILRKLTDFLEWHCVPLVNFVTHQ